jgi:lipopolysaccharide/colanic/teichoic acid biosynthesis glycosyltransferase
MTRFINLTVSKRQISRTLCTQEVGVVTGNKKISDTKRMIDLTLAGAAIAITAPVWPIIAIAIRRESHGPVLHRAERIGLDGVPFTILKFRSMAMNQGGPGITRAGDSRITRVGRVLRASKLDELPQLLNVMRGDMSLVGPRPEDPRYVARYDDRQRHVLSVRPGITGAASVAFRHEQEILELADDPEVEYVTNIMPTKLDLELRYIDSWSIWADVRLLAQTVMSIVQRSSSVAT